MLEKGNSPLTKPVGKNFGQTVYQRWCMKNENYYYDDDDDNYYETLDYWDYDDDYFAVSGPFEECFCFILEGFKSFFATIFFWFKCSLNFFYVCCKKLLESFFV